jgi:hypothetical protein
MNTVVLKWLLTVLAVTSMVTHATANEKIAVIFSGPTVDAESRDELADMMRSRGLQVVFVGTGQTTRELLGRAAVYVVPGGEER